MKSKGLSKKLILLLLLSSLLPLFLFGSISIIKIGIAQPTSEVYAAAYSLTCDLMLITVVFFVVIALIGYLGAKKYILTPISKIIEVTKEISSGKLGAKVTINTEDEFAVLGDAFNYMTGRLVELQEDMKNKEREAMLGKIAAGLIHDLKHPIGNIEMSSKLIQKMHYDEECRNTFKTVVEREFKNINRFLEDLHHFAKSRPMVFIAIDINRLMRELMESFDGKAKEAGILLTADMQPVELQISGDSFALIRVFNNIMINAVQAIQEKEEKQGTSDAARQKKRIHITTSRNLQGATVLVEIEDSGTGIPPEKISGIFNDYTTTKRKGLGLGLAICKKTINQHNGDILVKNVQDGGAKFSITIPVLAGDQSKSLS